MVSQFAEKCSALSLNLGYWLRVFPGKIDTYVIRLRHGRRFSIPGISRIGISSEYIVPLIFIIFQLVNDLYYVYFFLYCQYSLFDVIITAIFAATISTMTFFAELNDFFGFENTAALMNSFWILEHKFRKFKSCNLLSELIKIHQNVNIF